MKPILLHIVLLLQIMFLCACGGGETFKITGEIEGIGTQNLNVVYYADDAIRSARTTAVDGKFIFEGSSREWTLLYLFTNSHSLIGIIPIKNGDNVEAHYNIDNLAETELKGNKSAQQLAKWLKKEDSLFLSDDTDARNNAVRKFVEENKNDIVATIVLTNYYNAKENPSQADSLYKIIDSKVRMRYITDGWIDRVLRAVAMDEWRLPRPMYFMDQNDSLTDISTLGSTLLLYFSPKQRDVAIDEVIRDRLYPRLSDTLTVNLFEIDRYITDPSQWKTKSDADTIRKWKKLWHPFNSQRFPVNDDVSFIVIDTAGRIIYSGSDIEKVLEKAYI